MFILYTVAPLLYRMASSAYYNISLLTSDFYGLLFGMLSISIRFNHSCLANDSNHIQDYSFSYVHFNAKMYCS